MSEDATERFSSRVDDYVLYRPSYPDAIRTLLARRCGLSSRSVIADVGSGTGLLSRIFLDYGCAVYGIEPNAEMRLAGASLLSESPRFVSLDGRAEATTLPPASVDFVVAGQAFHWFDPNAARAEFSRILRPGGWVVLIWNERLVAATPFLERYEAALRQYSTDYAKVDHRNIDDIAIAAFFGHSHWHVDTFPNHQDFDLDGVLGRMRSSSYVPPPGAANHDSMCAEVAAAFEQHQQGGKVSFLYETKVFYGRLDA